MTRNEFQAFVISESTSSNKTMLNSAQKIFVAVAWALLISSTGWTQEVAETASPLIIGETFTINSKVLKETRRINVYSPPGYKQTSRPAIGVLYMPDGGIGEDFLHIAGLVQVSVGNETMRPFLLVGIENTERRRDMTGPTENPKDKTIAAHVGGSAAFRTFIRDELMPEIKRRYRTTDETAVMGESLAGLFVVETFLLEPDMFDTYIAIDPSLWWNDHKMADDAVRRPLTRSKTGKSLYLVSSGDDTADFTRRFTDALAKNSPSGVRLHYEKMPDEKHSTIYHPAALKALRWLFAPAPPK